MQSKRLAQLVDALRCLPGVGPKSAQRMAFHLLARNRQAGIVLGEVLQLAMREIAYCKFCRTYCEEPACQLCVNPRRDHSKLCVVETPADLEALEQSTQYEGIYFVLHGRLSPLDGIGPAELGLDTLQERIAAGGVEELIIAVGATLEGATTAHFLAELAKQNQVRATRLAQGIPVGGELEFVDGGTLLHALGARSEV